MEDKLVSIIVPVYNAGAFLRDTIKTVLKQTYTDWELLLINDCSTDNSYEIYSEYDDNRIIWIDLERNSGAALARNTGINNCRGDYICFLDSDDLWEVTKLEKQIDFMTNSNCDFSYTGYEFADENGYPNGKIVRVPTKITYKQSLKNTTIWTSTVMFNMKSLTKEDIFMPNVRRGQDTATWWKVLKKTHYAYGIDMVLSYYRRTPNSLSSNKIKALKRTWNLYRNVERFGIFKSLYYFAFYISNAVKRRI